MSDSFEPVLDEVVEVEGEAKEKRPRKNYGVDGPTFVKTWQESSSAAEVAEKLDMPKNIVLARKAVYANKGVNLKKMERKSPRKLDVDKLNEVAAAASGTATVAE